MKNKLLVSVVALGLGASAASAAPLELNDAELDGVTAGLVDLGDLLNSGPLLNLTLNVPIDITDVNVEIKDVNVNAVVNAGVVAPVLSPGPHNVTIRQRGKIRFKRR